MGAYRAHDMQSGRIVVAGPGEAPPLHAPSSLLSSDSPSDFPDPQRRLRGQQPGTQYGDPELPQQVGESVGAGPAEELPGRGGQLVGAALDLSAQVAARPRGRTHVVYQSSGDE